jgi:AraC-like DNA-binding protein/ligand-binding sensor protein
MKLEPGMGRIAEAVQHYSNATGIPVILIDDSGLTLYSSHENDLCRFCSGLCHEINCSHVHLYGSYQAERFGGKYVFFCPLGVVHWASPITLDGSLKGAVLGGPVHMVEPDEFLLSDILGKYFSKDQLSSAIEFAKKIPVVKTEKVNSLSELLCILASHLSDASWNEYHLGQKHQAQAADISVHIHHLKGMLETGEEISAYPIDKERELLSAIAVGNKPLSQKLLNEILGHIFFSSGNDFGLIRARVLELVVLLSRAVLDGGADIRQIFGLNYQYLNQLQSLDNLEELTPWLSRIMERFTDYVFNLTNVKHKDVILKSIDYIRNNYMKKLTLDEVAAKVYLSPSYFSKIFKEEMNMNFNTYLNHIRIEMSRKLLADPSISLVDVSSIVGFEDQSYFSKVFKKMTGQSPKRYRESRGKDY